MFKYIKYKLLEWKYDRILKKSPYHNWELYLHKNDIDIDPSNRTIEGYFVGYEHLAKVDYDKLNVEIDGMWGPIHNCQNVVAWCDKFCKGKYHYKFWTETATHEDQYSSIPKTNVDFLMVGFKDERDYIWFSLNWQ